MKVDRPATGRGYWLWAVAIAIGGTGCGASGSDGSSAGDAGETPPQGPACEETETSSPKGSAVVGTQRLAAFHRSGQTFITWPEDGAAYGESYVIYRASSPITSSNLKTATRIAEVDENSGEFTNEIESGSPFQTRFIIEDEGDELPYGVGLHVHTTHETAPGTYYYAVTEVINGVEQPLASWMTLSAGSGVTEKAARAEPVVVYTTGLKTLYTHWMDYSKWNPAFEGYAYNFWVGVPADRDRQVLPLQMHLHAYGESWQRFWSSGDDFGSGTPFNLEAVWIEPDDHRNTWWYGFANKVGRGEMPDASSTIVNYTEQRLDYLLDWITGPTSPYLIDTDRIYLYGGSMGGSGALSYGLRHPERFAAVYALIGMTDEAASTWGRDGLDTMWGDVDENLPTNEGIGVHDRLNTLQYMLEHRSDLPYLVTYHGRLDTTIEWSSQGLPWVEARNAARATGPAMWSDTDHTNSYDVYLDSIFADFPMTSFSLRKNESYLVFTDAPGDDDPRASIPGCRGEASTAYGYLGNSVEWASSADPFMGFTAPVDTATMWQSAIRIRSDLCNLPESGTVTATLHRAQMFRPLAGQPVQWENRSADGQLLQSGVVAVDSAGRVSIEGLEVSTDGSILTLSGEAPQGTPAPGGNGGDGEEGETPELDGCGGSGTSAS